MHSANKNIREYLRAKSIPLWEVADSIGVHENTVIRWMRSELDSGKREIVNNAISKIMEKREGGNA